MASRTLIVRGRILGMIDSVNLACVRLAEAASEEDPETSAELKRIHTILTAARRVIEEDS